MFSDNLLLQVQKPARYIGNEWNAIHKDFDKALVRIALCFPDIYELGMSNFGIRVLYGILNEMQDVVCERVFHPAADAEQLLRAHSLALFSLESQRPLEGFDIIGFSLGYELSYTNVLNILDLAGIPLYSSQRASRHPLIIAGGSCVLNPEPLAEFIDLFVIGEGEEAIKEIIDVYRRSKQSNTAIDRDEILYKLAQIQGVYVPSFYRAEYNQDGTLHSFVPKDNGIPSRIRKRIIQDLNQAFFPTQWMVPHIQIIHDRISLEAMRGCPNKCRFCQARSFYYPYRQRDPQVLLDLARQAYSNSGYEEISLLGLSVGDYCNVDKLLRDLIGIFKDKGVGISLPSIKAKDITGDLLSLITRIKKSGLTLAPEAGTDKLRRTLDKDLNIEEFFRTVEQAYALGYRHIKLYFMIGLPGETPQDLDGILDLSAQVSQLKKKVDKKAADVTLSIASLIPKPHTPFQWLGMDDLDAIKRKQSYIFSKSRSLPKIKVDFHNRFMSFLEGVMSRGDRRLSNVIMRAWQKGCKFDAWSDNFVFERWLEAFRESNIEPSFYLQRQRGDLELFPWDFIDIGITKNLLRAQFDKALTYSVNGSNI